jgi:hypothetical protein
MELPKLRGFRQPTQREEIHSIAHKRWSKNR